MKGRTYTVCCTQCYSFIKSGLTRKAADIEAVSHMNAYQHHVITNEEYKCTHPERPGKAGGQ